MRQNREETRQNRDEMRQGFEGIDKRLDDVLRLMESILESSISSDNNRSAYERFRIHHIDLIETDVADLKERVGRLETKS